MIFSLKIKNFYLLTKKKFYATVDSSRAMGARDKIFRSK